MQAGVMHRVKGMPTTTYGVLVRWWWPPRLVCERSVCEQADTGACHPYSLFPPAPLAARTFQQLCVHRPSPWQYPDPLQIMSFSFIGLVATIVGWLFGVDRVMPSVSCHVYFSYLRMLIFPGDEGRFVEDDRTCQRWGDRGKTMGRRPGQSRVVQDCRLGWWAGTATLWG